MNWEDINWTDGHISILKPKKVTRWRPRHVEIFPALRRHLEPFCAQERSDLPGWRASALRLTERASQASGRAGLALKLPAPQFRDVSCPNSQRLSQAVVPDGARECKHDPLQIWCPSFPHCRWPVVGAVRGRNGILLYPACFRGCRKDCRDHCDHCGVNFFLSAHFSLAVLFGNHR